MMTDMADAPVAALTEAEILAEILDEARRGFGPGESWAALADLERRFPVSIHALLERNGEAFVVHAFKELLGRLPDEAEMGYYRPALAEARLSKIEILGQIRYRPEGESMGRNVPGLRKRFLLQRSYRVPLLGRLLRLGSAILLLPRALREMQRLEQAAHADRMRLEAVEQHAAASGPGLAVRLAQLETRLADLERLERRLAELERRG